MADLFTYLRESHRLVSLKLTRKARVAIGSGQIILICSSSAPAFNSGWILISCNSI